MPKTIGEKGVPTRLVPKLVEGGLTHLQCVDEYTLFVHNLEQEIINLKFLLFLL
jgi:hypothetical protein